MSSNTKLKKSKGAMILLVLFLVILFNIIALFIYFAENNKETQPNQSLKVLDDETPLEYISAAKSGDTNTIFLNDVYETNPNNYNSNNHKSSSSSSSSSYLLSLICGNGITEQGEECDDGNDNDYDECTNLCEYRYYGQPDCGDNITEQGEECDDGNLINGDGCDSNCNIEKQCCTDEQCPEDSYSNKYCYNFNVWMNFTDYFCENTECLFNMTNIFIQDCGNETYSNEYCYDNNVYQNHSTPGCENGGCILSTEKNKVEDCGENSCEDWSDYVCEGKNKTRTRTCYEKGCEQATCFNNPNQEKESEECADICLNGECINQTIICNNDSDCGISHCNNPLNFCYNNDIFQEYIFFTCNNHGTTNSYCSNYTAPYLILDCGENSCNNFEDNYCKNDNVYSSRTCYERGCRNDSCFIDSFIEEQLIINCTNGCLNGECIEEFCGDGIINQANEECDDGNLINGDGCDENCNFEICEHDVGIRYSYTNSFGTGIAIKPNSSNDWLEDPVELIQNQDYIIKYIIDNKIENTTNNIHVIVSINNGGIIGYKKGVNDRGGAEDPGDPDVPSGGEPTDVPIYGNTTILADYNTSINIQHISDEIILDTLGLLPGTYNISVYVEKINEIDCNLSDNYAERQITIIPPEFYCGDNIVNGNEECDDGNLINGDGCDENCNFEINCFNNSDCGIDEWLSQDYCVCTTNVWDFWEIFECKNPGTSESYCTNRTEMRLKQECGQDSCTDYQNYCENNDVWKKRTCQDVGCALGACFNNTILNTTLVQDCGEDSCEDWSDYVCEGKNKTRTRTCYEKGCEQATCFNNPNQEKESEPCAYDCVDGECVDEPEPVCGNQVLELGEECDDGNLINGDGCDENCNFEICEHDVGIRYSYTNSFGTGIAIKPNGTNDWLEDPVELIQNQDYIIKYIIDNKIENTTNNIHVVVKINNEGIIGWETIIVDAYGRTWTYLIPIYGNTTILADYNTSINNYHAGEVDLTTLGIIPGTYNLSVYVEKINEIDCNLSDNYAERQITIIPPEFYCGDNIVNGNEECDDGNLINGDGCDSNCETELCYGIPIPPAEQCKAFYCDPTDGQIKEEYANFPLSTPCEADNEECTIDHCDGLGTCVLLEDNCDECCDDEDCPEDSYSNNYCYYNDVWKNLTDYFCQNGECLFNISSIFFQDCGTTLYGEWNYYCVDKEIWKNKTDIFRGCSNSECFEDTEYKDEYVDYCEQECVDGECKGECETNEDCSADYYESSYCGGNTCPESVFKDFHDFSCTPRKKCVETITPTLIDECDFTCLDNRCVNSNCDGVDLSNCKEWVDCVCVDKK